MLECGDGGAKHEKRTMLKTRFGKVNSWRTACCSDPNSGARRDGNDVGRSGGERHSSGCVDYVRITSTCDQSPSSNTHYRRREVANIVKNI